MTDEPVTAAGIGRHITQLTAAGPRHPRRGSAAVAASLRYLTERFTGCGYRVSVERFGPELYDVNLLAEPAGAAGPVALEVGAHWDTVDGSPGADDNASGLAGVLEVARVLGGSGRVRLCAFGGEEDGLRGSMAHVERLAGAVGAIVLEMIGYRARGPGSQRVPADLAALVDPPPHGDFIAVVADEASVGYAEAFVAGAQAVAPDLGVYPVAAPAVILPTLARSDHLPYWSSGRRALLVTDTAEFRNPHYHLASDTIDTLDLEFAAEVTRAVVATVHRLDPPDST